MINLKFKVGCVCLSDNKPLCFQDEKLKKLVELHGSEDWKLIASLLSVSSSSSNCKVSSVERFASKSEFLFMPLFIFAKQSRDCEPLCALTCQNRTDVQCQHRWQKVLNPELIKGPWTKEEDQRVSEGLRERGVVLAGNRRHSEILGLERKKKKKERKQSLCTKLCSNSSTAVAHFSAPRYSTSNTWVP